MESVKESFMLLNVQPKLIFDYSYVELTIPSSLSSLSSSPLIIEVNIENIVLEITESQIFKKWSLIQRTWNLEGRKEHQM